MLKMSGLKIIKKIKISREINFKSAFSKHDKEIIKDYVNDIMQTDYTGKCINIAKQNNGLITFSGNNNFYICELYLAEIKLLNN